MGLSHRQDKNNRRIRKHSEPSAVEIKIAASIPEYDDIRSENTGQKLEAVQPVAPEKTQPTTESASPTLSGNER